MKRYSNLLSMLTMAVLLTLFAVSENVFAQDKAAKVDELLLLYQQNRQFNGAALVAENGKVIFKKGYGLANMEWNIPNQPDTKFRLGSITKQFTSMLIAQLIEQGKISLEDKLSDHLPDYRKDTGDKVTILHLLKHTSGIPSYTGLPRFFQDLSRDPYSVDEFVKKHCSGDLQFEPGSKYAYNNSGYFLLGAIIEKVTGKPYEQVLKERILDPLGMKDTGYDHHNTLLNKRAAGYEKTLAGFENAPYLDMSLPYAAGSLYSTVEDLYLWDQALYTDKLISPKRKEAMFTPHLNNYAEGWIVNKLPIGQDGERVSAVMHGGGINGFNTVIIRIVDDKHLIVLLNNTGGTNLNGMARGIANILYGKPYDPPKASVAETILKTVEEKGVEQAIKRYRDLKANHSDAYDFRENELNNLGYHLLRSDKVKQAIEIFKLNVEAYPRAANVYDSLGEAYMADGQKELAIENYKKSLELNPNNTGAVEKLKELNANEQPAAAKKPM